MPNLVRTAHVRKMLDWAHTLATLVEGADVGDRIPVPEDMRLDGTTCTTPQALAFAADLCLHAAAELRMEYEAKHGWSQP